MQYGVCYVGVPSLYLPSCVMRLHWFSTELCRSTSSERLWLHPGWLQLWPGGYLLRMANNRLIFKLSYLHQEVSCAHSENDARLSLWTALAEIVMAHSLIQITINLSPLPDLYGKGEQTTLTAPVSDSSICFFPVFAESETEFVNLPGESKLLFSYIY